MKPLLITKKELEYLTNIPQMAREEAPATKPKLNIEEELKDCITLDEFSKMWEESINRLIPNL